MKKNSLRNLFLTKFCLQIGHVHQNVLSTIYPSYTSVRPATVFPPRMHCSPALDSRSLGFLATRVDFLAKSRGKIPQPLSPSILFAAKTCSSTQRDPSGEELKTTTPLPTSIFRAQTSHYGQSAHLQHIFLWTWHSATPKTQTRHSTVSSLTVPPPLHPSHTPPHPQPPPHPVVADTQVLALG